ncbi:MAG: hypothetical protein WD988_02020 [Candidatus Curtissbacteria bacterium]
MNIKDSILATLAYHDIFDYPLTLDQIHNLLTGQATDLKKVQKAINVLIKSKKVQQKNHLFFLEGRGQTARLRLQKKRYSAGKLKKARLYARVLALVPTVQMVALSGALAMENAAENDDIDLVIVTSKNTLWITRLLANIMLQPFRRRAGEPHTKDKACLNLFLEESSLKIPTQNLYTAHETVQMKPLWQRQNAYQRFLKANTWVKYYIPNWQPPNADSAFSFPQLGITRIFEKPVKDLQLFYMKKKITTEKVGKYQLFFHPRNTEEWVLREYVKKLNMLNKRYSLKETSQQSSSFD